MATPNGSHPNWADQVPIAVAPLNSVPYTGPPLDSDMAQENEISQRIKYQPAMVFLPQQTPGKELEDILLATKSGIAVSGTAASQIGPLIGSFDISESNECFLFRVALPGVKKDDTFKCDIVPDGTITIKGVTETGEKKVYAHNMVFEMHSQNLSPPGDFSISFTLPAHIDPSTLEHVLENGVLEGVVKKKPIQGS